MGKVYVFIPAYNEERQISKTILAIRSSFEPDEIIVVDDGSSDKTLQYSKKSGAQVIRIPRNMGKGRALKRALYEEKINRMNDEDIVILADADLGESAIELKKLIKPVKNGEADLTIAVFPAAKIKGGFGFVKKLSGFILSRICRKSFRAPLSGQRAFKASLLPEIKPAFGYGFGLEVAMTILTFKKGGRIEEIETELSHRETGRNVAGFLHRGKQFLSVLSVGVDSILGRL